MNPLSMRERMIISTIPIPMIDVSVSISERQVSLWLVVLWE